MLALQGPAERTLRLEWTERGTCRRRGHRGKVGWPVSLEGHCEKRLASERGEKTGLSGGRAASGPQDHSRCFVENGLSGSVGGRWDDGTWLGEHLTQHRWEMFSARVTVVLVAGSGESLGAF